MSHCPCGVDLKTPYERRIGNCYECERMDDRMHCATCREWVGLAYMDGSLTFCSPVCMKRWYRVQFILEADPVDESNDPGGSNGL